MTQAVVMREYGPADVLVPGQVDVAEPGPGQVRIDVRYAGVGPTDLALRAGHLKGAFGSGPGSVLGFEVAGTVNAVGPQVSDVAPGDAVAAFLPDLGGYAGQVLARHWVSRPDSVSEQDAAALPASGEAALRVIDELAVQAGETVLIVGAAGSVGLLASQLALGRGARVVGAARPGDADLLTSLEVIPVDLTPDLAAVRALVGQVDAVVDASGAGVLGAAVELAGGPQRVVTLSDHRAADHGVRLSGPDLARTRERLHTVMAEFAAGHLRLRSQQVFPLLAAAAVHQSLETGKVRGKVLLAIGDTPTSGES